MTYQAHFPDSLHGLKPARLKQLSQELLASFRAVLKQQQVDGDHDTLFKRFYLPLAATLAKAAADRSSPLVVGINGAQGSGKTTLCHVLQRLLEDGFGLRVAGFSIDDLYLTRAERLDLGQAVHPLLATRGVPGTHDVALGQKLLDELTVSPSGRTVAIPVFDKARDDRTPRSEWRSVQTPIDLVLFEGWCVGAVPQPEAALIQPVNLLERDEDPQVIWRRYVNHRLQDDYARLFARIDLLIMLEIPDMACVQDWRGLQERKLAARSNQENRSCIMDEAVLRRFIMHYERLTSSMLAEMPWRANLALLVDREHRLAGVRNNFSKTKKINNRT